VDVDEQGFIRLDRYRDNKKINLRRDARFEMLESIRDLSEQYILELKLRRKAIEGDEDGVERIIMVRYVVFTHFSQALYPLIYMIILRRILGTTLAHRTICLDNKLSEEAPGGIGIDSQLDMFNEQQVIELEQIYEKLQESFLKPFAFPELARKHSKFINEILPKSKFSEFIKRAFVVAEFKDKMIQVLSIFNYADLRPQIEDPLSPLPV
jgi:hypothetical protein